MADTDGTGAAADSDGAGAAADSNGCGAAADPDDAEGNAISTSSGDFRLFLPDDAFSSFLSAKSMTPQSCFAK